jgi:hypothetical protein
MAPRFAHVKGPITSRALPVVHWLLWLALLVLQFSLFHRNATREVVWAYPRHCDQAVYLERAYETHLHIVRDGLWHGLAYGAGFNGGDPSANGALLHLQAALLFCIVGPSRLAALSLIFAYFAAFQAVLFSTLHAVSRRWSIAWVGLGLLLTARTTFQEIGGIMDFRFELAAMCLFGIFLCCVIRSGVFQRLWWSLAAGAFAAFTMAFRFITVAYFIPIFAMTLLMLICCRLGSRRCNSPVAAWTGRIRNLLIAGVFGSIIVGPILLHHQHAVSTYYLRLHATGQERFERAAMYNVMEWGAALKFYPQALYLHHCGVLFFGLVVTLLIAGAMIPATSRAPAVSGLTDRRLGIGFCLIAFLVPLAILNCDVDKEFAVGNIMLPPILWLAVLLARFPLAAPGRPGSLRAGFAWPVAAAAAGAFLQVASYLRHSDLSLYRPQVTSILAMYDAIDASSRQRGWTDPAVADDASSQYQFAPTIDVTIYERHGRLIHAREVLANGLLAKSREQILNAVQSADYVLLSEPRNKNDAQDLFEQSTHALHSELLDYCRSHLTHLCDCSAPERQITVFVRRMQPMP